MDNKVFEKLEKLVREGKITPEERKEIEEAMGLGKEAVETKLGTPKEIECSCFGGVDFEVSGDETINEVVIEEGSDIVETNLVGDVLKISNRSYGRGFLEHLRIRRVKMRVPLNMTLIDIKLVSGDLSARNLHSDINVTVVSGDVKVSELVGKLKINAISGDISMHDLNGELEVVTKSGDIYLENAKVKGPLKTYSGDIVAKNVDFGEFKISTFSGDLKLADTSFGGNGEISTYFGDISINGDLSNVSINAQTLHGDLSGIKFNNGSLNKGNNLHEIIARTKSGDISVKDTSQGG
jgi:DUF4097 and DUF4098 domain-containing protein YvlB